MGEPNANSDLLPLYDSSRGFDTVLRGYDKAQVEREVSRLDDDIRVTASERDSAAARSADLAAQLASSQAQIESLRRQLRAASETVNEDNVDEKVTQILQNAASDGAKVRADAQARAEQITNGAADAAARTRAAAQAEAERITGAANDRMREAEDTYKRRIAETEAHKTEVETSLAAAAQHTREEEARLSAEAEAERNRLDAEASAERRRLDVTADTERKRADDDFEITLRMRRTAAHESAVEQKRTADASAKATVDTARATAAQLVADATHEVRRLHGVRDDTHAQLDALAGQLRASLEQSRSATPAEPELAASDSRPHPGPGVEGPAPAVE